MKPYRRWMCMSTKEEQITERAKKHRNEALTNLNQFIDLELLDESFHKLNKKSRGGVDGIVWEQYEPRLSSRLPELLGEFKSGRYKAPAIRRVYIPKGTKDKRPLGIPTVEDKILQESVRHVVEPIYETEFKEFSFGYRKGRSAHDTVNYLFREVSFKGLRYIIDADLKSYFESIDHGFLREFLARRVTDGVVRKMIDKWLKAGILEDKTLYYPDKGTPQGGVVSPLLSNVYLHYVLDCWFSEEIQPLLYGRSCIVRYADDFILGFSDERDVKRVMNVLPKRLEKYNLCLNREKTKIIHLENNDRHGSRSFDFLGFTHYLGKSMKGKTVLKRKTSKKKLNIAVKKIAIWIKDNRHIPLKDLIKSVNMKLRGHYGYYGITFNSRSLSIFYRETEKILHKWINRRGGKAVWQWDTFSLLVNKWNPLLKPKIYRSYQRVNLQ